MPTYGKIKILFQRILFHNKENNRTSWLQISGFFLVPFHQYQKHYQYIKHTFMLTASMIQHFSTNISLILRFKQRNWLLLKPLTSSLLPTMSQFVLLLSVRCYLRCWCTRTDRVYIPSVMWRIGDAMWAATPLHITTLLTSTQTLATAVLP